MDTVALSELWMPIILASVLVFIASSIVWMVLPHHKKDWARLPDEDGLMEAMRVAGLQPGQYAFPNCDGDMKKMAEPEFVAKMEAGPVGILFVGPSGKPNMGKSLLQWFVYTLVVSVFVAYVTGMALGPGAEYLKIFQISGTAAILGYCAAIVPNGIWKNMSWSTIFKELIDGAVYGLLTAGAIAGFWPDGI